MKKILVIALALLVIMLSSCAPADGGNNDKTEEETLKSVNEILENTDKELLECPSYDLDKYLSPVWSEQIIYNETVMFISDKDGNIEEKSLMYPIAKVLEVRNAQLDKVYVEGKDYKVNGSGKLELLSGTEITVTPYSEYYLDKDKTNGNPGAMSKTETGKYLDYGEGVYFYYKQVCVTYISTEKYAGPKQASTLTLEKSVKKLKSKENINILFYGDSITTGCNASSQVSKAPNMPKFDEMVIDKLKDFYGNENINVKNTAVGGWTSENGKNDYTKRVIENNPDLLVLGFGMNDGTWNVSEDTFGNNIFFMIDKLKKANPNAEVILLSTMLPNPDAISAVAGDYLKKQSAYLQTLKDIATGFEGVCIADITSMHSWLLDRKDYCDMTGNNINHPSDFLVRIYSQIILSNLINY